MVDACKMRTASHKVLRTSTSRRYGKTICNAIQALLRGYLVICIACPGARFAVIPQCPLVTPIPRLRLLSGTISGIARRRLITSTKTRRQRCWISGGINGRHTGARPTADVTRLLLRRRKAESEALIGFGALLRVIWVPQFLYPRGSARISGPKATVMISPRQASA